MNAFGKEQRLGQPVRRGIAQDLLRRSAYVGESESGCVGLPHGGRQRVPLDGRVHGLLDGRLDGSRSRGGSFRRLHQQQRLELQVVFPAADGGRGHAEPLLAEGDGKR